MEQHAFDFGLEEKRFRPKRPERLFLALLPAGEVQGLLRNQAVDLLEDAGGFGTLLWEGRFHLSLHHVRDDWRLRDKHVFAASRAARDIRFAPIEIVLDRAVSFAGSRKMRPTVLLGRGEGLAAFHAMLGQALIRWGLRAASAFTPHVTLFYAPKAITARSVAPIRFRMNEFVLIHSLRGLSRYEILGRWPFDAGLSPPGLTADNSSAALSNG